MMTCHYRVCYFVHIALLIMKDDMMVDYIYIYIHMYLRMFEDIKCFDTDVNFVYTRMTRTFNDDDQCNPWKKVRP
jgi:hypothetical protein